eukprot:1011559-Amorphochlora_amoeboformis.AAC.1
MPCHDLHNETREKKMREEVDLQLLLDVVLTPFWIIKAGLVHCGVTYQTVDGLFSAELGHH